MYHGEHGRTKIFLLGAREEHLPLNLCINRAHCCFVMSLSEIVLMVALGFVSLGSRSSSGEVLPLINLCILGKD